jgi:hypothetical protein
MGSFLKPEDARVTYTLRNACFDERSLKPLRITIPHEVPKPPLKTLRQTGRSLDRRATELTRTVERVLLRQFNDAIRSLVRAGFWLGLAHLPIPFATRNVAINDLSTHLRKTE